MVIIILDDITETETQRIELDEDLIAAAEIQRSLLPSKLPDVGVIEVAWQFIPCKRIGGDIFNVIQLDGDHWAIYMIDVSGHGVASAMIAVSISQMMQLHTGYLLRRSADSASGHEIVSPAEVLDALNREYPFERFDNFFTISYLVLNTRDGLLRYSSAAHPLPVLVGRDGDVELLERGGPVIGMDRSTRFREATRRLRPGDRLFIYTDGIDEYQNREGEFYGKDRFYDTLHQARGEPVSRMVDSVVKSVMEFGANHEPQDDISLLGVEYRGGA